MINVHRRTLLKTALAGTVVVGAGGVAACAPSIGGPAAGKTPIRYGWWGGSARQQMYLDAFKVFADRHPDIEVRPEFADYVAFQERMTTQIAGRRVPEVFWIASAQVLTYHRAGLFHDLEGLDALDLNNFSDQQLDAIRIDGKVNTVNLSSTMPCARYNANFLEEAGGTIPEYGSAGWTWEAAAEFLTDYTADAGDGRKGIAYNAQQDLTFEHWLRQCGEQLWTEDGEVGFSQEALAGWFEWWEKLRKAGAALSIQEQEGAGMNWQVAGDKVLMTFGNSNHLNDHAKDFPDYDFQLTPIPTLPDAADGHMYVFFNRVGIFADTAESSLEAAATLLNFTITDPAMIPGVLSLGAPGTASQLEAAKGVASDDELKMLDYIETHDDPQSRPRYEAPAGASTWRDIMTRSIEEIALERSSIGQASADMITAISVEIDRAR